MKKTRTTYEQATKEYTERFNEIPTVQKNGKFISRIRNQLETI